MDRDISQYLSVTGTVPITAPAVRFQRALSAFFDGHSVPVAGSTSHGPVGDINESAAEIPGEEAVPATGPTGLQRVLSSIPIVGQWFNASPNTSNSGSSQDDVSRESALAISNWERRYGRQHPDFHSGTFERALKDANDGFKMLLICFHSPDHDDTFHFSKNVLGKESVVDMINDNFACWLASVDFPAPQALCQQLGVTTYPFFSVVTKLNGNNTRVAHREGLCDHEELLSWLGDVLERLGPQMVALRAEHDEIVFNRELREQQEREYAEALEQDRLAEEAAERQAQEEEQCRLRQEQEVAQQQAEMRQKEELRERRVSEAKTTLPDEPATSDPNAIRVAVRCPDGKSMQRRFLKSETVSTLRLWILADGGLPFVEFALCIPFPRQVLSDDSITLGEAGIAGQRLVVEELS